MQYETDIYMHQKQNNRYQCDLKQHEPGLNHYTIMF